MQNNISANNPSSLSAKALELQNFILVRQVKYANRPVRFEKDKWDFQEENSLTLLRHAAKAAGFTEADFKARNEMVAERLLQLAPIGNLHRGLVATYVTSSNYYNTPARKRYNPAQQLIPQPLTLSMADIISKFRRESEEAAYAWGQVLEGSVSAMKLQKRFSSELSIYLLRSLLAENKKPRKSMRGVHATLQFINALNYYADNDIIVKSDQFLSTTSDWNIASSFSSGQYDSVSDAETDKKVIFIVNGYSGASITSYLDEGEILYPPETCFRVSRGSAKDTFPYFGYQVFKLTEVSAPARPDKIAILADTGKMQRLAARQAL